MITASSHVSRRQQRGSVLLVALFFAMVIALSLGSYMSLVNNTIKSANRSFYYNGAINLAESGLEQGLWSVNKAVAGAGNAWTDWTIDGSAARQTFANWDFGPGVTGVVKVRVYNYAGSSTKRIVARAILTTPNMAPVEKWLSVDLNRRSRFSNGLVAKDSVTFNGNNAVVDSWVSDPDNSTSTPVVAYSSAVRRDHGSVGSVSILNTAVAVNNADIWGSAATGAADPQVGANGSILGADSAAKDKSTWANAKVDPSRVSTDFTANFDPVAQPTGSCLGSLGAGTIGTEGATTTLTYTNLTLTSKGTLVVKGNVTLLLTATAGTSAIHMAGQSTITIPAGSSLTIYTAGNIKIAGNGLANNNDAPITCQIWGTSTSATKQDIQIAGNGALKAVVYAPNGSVKVNGNGDVMGSVVADDITLVGNAAFHYDESLANLDADATFRIGKWSELTTASARAALAADFNF